MDAAEFSTALDRLDARPDVREWARGKTLRQAWRACKRGDQMLWLVAKCLPREVAVGVTCEMVECLALPYVPRKEKRPAEALRAARLWCDGRATYDEVRNAARAATAAAHACNLNGMYHAAYAARSAADAAYVASTARIAANAANAAHAAAFAAVYAAENAAARYASLRAAAEIVRAMVAVEDIEEVCGVSAKARG